VAIAVRDTDVALRSFQDRLGLPLVHSEVLERQQLRLTYVDAGNVLLQLVEPLSPGSELAEWLESNGEGIHHICFGVDDPIAAAMALAPRGAPPPVLGSGRGRISSFIPGELRHGVRIECTEFREEEDAGTMLVAEPRSV
jgi:methylmalonyl-CoA epimerase